MRLVTFRVGGKTTIGHVKGDKVVDLHAAFESKLESEGKLRAAAIAEAYVPQNMVEFLQGGSESMQAAKDALAFVDKQGETYNETVLVYPLSGVSVDAPLKNPGKIICIGHNYADHIKEMGRELPKVPVVFAKYANTIIAHGEPIPKPILSDQLDYEAELAAVIGKRGRHISEEEALEYVAGYTIANDVSVRDYQKMTLEFLKGKTFDGTLPLGPHLVTADELFDPHHLDIQLQVNGEVRQRSNTKNLVFDVSNLVSFLSGIMTLEPGDIILTGTPGGVGVARDPQVFLKEGDVVSVEVEGIGVLENPVKNEQ